VEQFSPYAAYSMKNLCNSTLRFFYRCTEYRSCHGMFRQVQACCALQLPCSVWRKKNDPAFLNYVPFLTQDLSSQMSSIIFYVRFKHLKKKKNSPRLATKGTAILRCDVFVKPLNCGIELSDAKQDVRPQRWTSKSFRSVQTVSVHCPCRYC